MPMATLQMPLVGGLTQLELSPALPTLWNLQSSFGIPHFAEGVSQGQH